MKKPKRYIIGMLLLLPICLLMYTFAYTAENIRVFFCVLEALGAYDGYKYTTRNTILWIIVILLLIVLLKVAFYLIKSDRDFLKQNRFQKRLPYFILSFNILICLLFPKINLLFLHFQDGLDSVIMPDRGIASLLTYFSYKDGTPSDPALHVQLESCGSKSKDFYIKYVDIEDETKQYVYCDDNGTPQKISMGSISDIWDITKGNYKARGISLGLDIENVIPGYIDTPENRAALKYKLVIFNDNDSKTFYYYFD